MPCLALLFLPPIAIHEGSSMHNTTIVYGIDFLVGIPLLFYPYSTFISFTLALWGEPKYLKHQVL